MVSGNHDTLTLPRETKRTKCLLLSYTRKTETPSSQTNSKDLDSTKNHLDQPRTNEARKAKKNPNTEAVKSTSEKGNDGKRLHVLERNFL